MQQSTQARQKRKHVSMQDRIVDGGEPADAAARNVSTRSWTRLTARVAARPARHNTAQPRRGQGCEAAAVSGLGLSAHTNSCLQGASIRLGLGLPVDVIHHARRELVRHHCVREIGAAGCRLAVERDRVRKMKVGLWRVSGSARHFLPSPSFTARTAVARKGGGSANFDFRQSQSSRVGSLMSTRGSP